jgi:hypothetical protein
MVMCPALRVVEIGRDSDDSVINGCSGVGFRSFLHLDEVHLRDEKKSIREKDGKRDNTHNFFLLSSILNTDIGFVCLAEDLERESA